MWLLTFYSEAIVCKEPIEVVSYKIGVCKVSLAGKDCHTEFRRLSFNGKTSVVLCRPLTGRMHQIRVHLQFLGKEYTLFIALAFLLLFFSCWFSLILFGFINLELIFSC